MVISLPGGSYTGGAAEREDTDERLARDRTVIDRGGCTGDRCDEDRVDAVKEFRLAPPEGADARLLAELRIP